MERIRIKTDDGTIINGSDWLKQREEKLMAFQKCAWEECGIERASGSMFCPYHQDEMLRADAQADEVTDSEFFFPDEKNESH